MRQIIIIIGLCCWLSGTSYGQALDSLNFLDGIEADGDTLPHRQLEEIPVFPKMIFKNKAQERRYYRLEQKVKKVYPFAVRAGELLEKYEAEYLAAKDEKTRRHYVRQAEQELFDRYGPQLKKLSLSEGRILIKLIDRQTGHTSFDLIKDLKGGLTAFFWQGVARIFGNDLKEEYDPVIEDILIEKIIFQIEAGMI
jgi:hypothetical protein